jgi:phosphohistidine phosphatase
MNLVIVRHGPAGDRETWQAEGGDDRERPLTPDGKKQMRRAAAGLSKLVSGFDLLASSPLVRAMESAEIVAEEFGVDITTLELLMPEADPDNLVPWLAEQDPETTIAVVGHEPHLSTLVGHLVTGKSRSFITLKKAGSCMVELSNPIKAGTGTLGWLLTPKALRRLGE